VPANEIHKNDVGTIFTITVYDGSSVVDISTATDKQIIFHKPNDDLLNVSGSFYTNGVDGKLTYTFVSGDLNQAGHWKMQAYLTFPSGNWYSDITKFKVHNNL
jgi:hypothetical protein